ncbi:SRPBCC family protein [Labedaea rhizosphaerae]|uniref:Carbon monoxide dehydrogenase subunit G n=1 Tax=Labedaea rhizosphaerae TaxID=598644 RepID=A0A4R6SKH4_LABRH|nr:SRPBCC family protein [Labedaea rhizosphaerae]TDQ04579.1 carbon monoxide dehydrogenase subunit G [Labedaea rhizosphaerae]
MQLEHKFQVPAPIDTVWQAVLDPERVAPCMPGATLTSVEGDTFAGTVKVKLGPISLLYKGSGEFLEQDEAARKVVIKASGKDSRGNGTAAATVTVTLASVDDGTEGTVHTDLAITGRPAQFGRGLIAEVGGKILNAFSECLAAKLGTTPDASSAPAASSSSVPAEEAPGQSAAEKAEPPPAAEKPAAETPAAESAAAKPRLVEPQPTSEPIDLMEFAGASVAKRAAPVAAALLALIIFLIIRRRR